MFSHFDNNWHKSHTKLNICEIIEISYNHLNFLTSFSDTIYITKIVIPTYTMGIFKIPKALCDTINSTLEKYRWDQTKDEKKIH